MKSKFLVFALLVLMCFPQASFAEPGEIEIAITDQATGHHYQLFEKRLSWTDAKLYCESLGGYLATITSPEEQHVINTLITYGKKASYFIGGTSKNEDFTWQWITGEEFQFANWANRQPDNSNGVEFYLMVYQNGGVWNDIDLQGENINTTTFGFICEWPSNTQIGIVTITNNTVNVRAGAGYTYDITETIHENEKYECVEVLNNGWYAIKLPDGSIGYIPPDLARIDWVENN